MVTPAITSVTVVRYHCVVNTQSARNKEGVINKIEKRICQKNDNTDRSFSQDHSYWLKIRNAGRSAKSTQLFPQ